eukprot:COSAG01_NODE_6567_length_3605_cov_4.754136_1_plen_299_part_00
MQQACWAARWAAAAVVGAPPVRAIRSGIHARRQMWAPVRWGHSGAKRNGEPTGGSKPNRAKRGLFGGKVIQSGNNVSFSINRYAFHPSSPPRVCRAHIETMSLIMGTTARNKRVWKPNAHEQKLYSELLGCKLKVMVTASMLRTIDKHGGLDNYLLKVSVHAPLIRPLSPSPCRRQGVDGRASPAPLTAVCAVQTSDEKIDSDVGVKFKRMLEARLRQLEQEKNREGGRKGGHAADAPAAPGVAWTEAEEAHLTRLVEQVRRAEGIVLGAGDWRRVALELVSRPVTHRGVKAIQTRHR